MDGWMDEREEESERERACARVCGVFFPSSLSVRTCERFQAACTPTHTTQRERETQRERGVIVPVGGGSRCIREVCKQLSAFGGFFFLRTAGRWM